MTDNPKNSFFYYSAQVSRWTLQQSWIFQASAKASKGHRSGSQIGEEDSHSWYK